MRIQKTDTEDVGSSGGEEELASNKFEALRANHKASYAEVAVGAMSAILLEQGQPPSIEDQEKMSAKSKLRKKQRLKRKEGPRPKQTSMCRLANSDDESESDAPVLKNPKKSTAKQTAGSSQKIPQDEGEAEGCSGQAITMMVEMMTHAISIL